MKREARDVFCRTCGVAFRWEPSAKGGREPRHCEAHRKARSSRGDVAASKARALEQRRRRRAGEAAARVAADDHQIARLAIELSTTPDAAQAARVIGLDVDAPTAEALAALARARHAPLTDPSDMRVLRAEGRRLALLALREASARVTEVAPAQLAGLIARAAQVVESTDATGAAPRYATISLSVVGPDGTKAALG